MVFPMTGTRQFWTTTSNSLSSLAPELRKRFATGLWFFDLPDTRGNEMITPRHLFLVHARGCEGQLIDRDIAAIDEAEARIRFAATIDEQHVIDDVEPYDPRCPDCESDIVADVMADDGSVLYGTCECPFQPCWLCREGGAWKPSGHLPTAAELVAWIVDNAVGWEVHFGQRRWAIVPVSAKFGMVSDGEGICVVRWFDDEATAYRAMCEETDR